MKASPYNAVGNGVTDDRVAIQAAIDAANALFVSSGQPVEVYFPPGTYYVTRRTASVVVGPLYLYGHLWIRSGVRLEGHGAARILMQPTPRTTLTAALTVPVGTGPVTATVASTAAFDAAVALNQVQFGTNDVLTFTVTSATTLSLVGEWDWSADGTVFPIGTVLIQRVATAGLQTVPDETIVDWSVRGLIVDGNTTDGAEWFQSGLQVQNAARFEIADNEFRYTLGKPVFVNSKTDYVNAHFSIARNRIHDCTSNAISVDSGGTDFEIVDNDCWDARSGVEGLFCGFYHATTPMPAVRGVIARNRFRNYGTIDIFGSDLKVLDNYADLRAASIGPAMRVHGGARIQIRGNTLDARPGAGSDAHALRFEESACTDLDVSNNVLLAHDGTAIQMRPGPRFARVRITNNTIQQKDATSASAGVEVYYVDELTITGNQMKAFSATPSLLVITDTTRAVVKDNILSNARVVCAATPAIIEGNEIIVTLDETSALVASGNNSLIVGNYISGRMASGYALLYLDSTASNCVVSNNRVATNHGGFAVAIGETGSGTNNVFVDNSISGFPAWMGASSASRLEGTVNFKTEGGGSASVVNGGTIAHGLAVNPSVVNVTASVAKREVAVTAKDGTNLTIALHDDTGAAIAVAETVYWEARR